MNEIRGNAMVGQSGGPTAAINATLGGIVRGVLKNEYIDKLYGLRNGIEGLINKKYFSLNETLRNEEDLCLLETTPASALGSCRIKLPEINDAPQIYEDMFNTFKEENIRYFFYIGGNDSMDTVKKLSEYAAYKKEDIRIIGVPKTIDNDLIGTDHTPGFGSAAKYIAASMQEIICDHSVYTMNSVIIAEIMGRNAGWLTAAAALPRLHGGAAPDYVYLPETKFDIEKLYSDITEGFKSKPYVTIAVSEGLKYEDGSYVGSSAQSGESDNFGHKYLSGTARVLSDLVKKKLNCKTRAVEFNILQRCAAHLGSLRDITESAAIGEEAVSTAVSGISGVMMCIRRLSTSPYSTEFSYENVDVIANKIRFVPDDFINSERNNVTDDCLHYIMPLIIGESKIIYENGLPVQFKFRQ